MQPECRHAPAKLRAFFLAAVCALIPLNSLAIDINPPQTEDIKEAAVFFIDLMNTTNNPIIAAFARENLDKLKRRNEQVEVTLLPQLDNTFVVPAFINRTFMASFLIDTGASQTVITPETAQMLGVEITEETPTVSVTTANGTVEAPLVTLKSISLGGILVKDVEAVVADLGGQPQLSGLLGMSFFRGMEISFKNDRLIINR